MAVVVLVIGLIAVFAYKDAIRGILPILRPVPPTDTAPTPPNGQNGEGENTTGMPLWVPDGFSISIFARNLPDVRVMAFDDFGSMWVSQPGQGAVSMIEIGDDGAVVRQGAVLRDLRGPHGLAFDPAHPFALYIAEEDKISRIGVYSDGPMEKIADLPTGGAHSTRSLGFGPDGRLYVSIGSSCNVCDEVDSRRAAILSMDLNGGDIKEYAHGLRNAVFFTWHPETDKMWATEMGRDMLGDDIPPDEINIIEEGRHYGWPLCYGKNIHDLNFDSSGSGRDFCAGPQATPSIIDIPAHSAPLGLAFLHNTDEWPLEYRNDLIVAYHGSWNRSDPTGYKLVRFMFDEDGAYRGAEDFISGWFSDNELYGRPADVKVGPDGALYVSDDRAGVIYRISYEG